MPYQLSNSWLTTCVAVSTMSVIPTKSVLCSFIRFGAKRPGNFIGSAKRLLRRHRPTSAGRDRRDILGRMSGTGGFSDWWLTLWLLLCVSGVVEWYTHTDTAGLVSPGGSTQHGAIFLWSALLVSNAYRVTDRPCHKQCTQFRSLKIELKKYLYTKHSQKLLPNPQGALKYYKMILMRYISVFTICKEKMLWNN